MSGSLAIFFLLVLEFGRACGLGSASQMNRKRRKLNDSEEYRQGKRTSKARSLLIQGYLEVSEERRMNEDVL